MKRLLLLLGIALAFVAAWLHLNEVSLTVIGQPSSTGVLQRDKEQPFFADLKARTGLPLQINYRPLEAVGFKDTFQLQMLRDGVFDLASLRFLQNSESEPSLLGIDLAGMSPDYATARKVVAAYSGTVDRYLQHSFKAKLLGIWTFGPQEIFCKQPLQRLQDIEGRKVRVGSTTLSGFITALGGVAVVVPFDDTNNALVLGLIDCAITSAASANYAGWVANAPFNFQLAVHFGLNGYAISLKKWNALSAREQALMLETFDRYLADLWQFTQGIQVDAYSCNTGGTCLHGKPYRGAAVAASEQDVRLLREILEREMLPAWGERCDKLHPGCLSEWKNKLGPLLGPI